MCKYQCHECDRRFEEPDIVTEIHGMTDGSCEKIGVCPYCHGYYGSMQKCKICGEYFTEDELENGVCDECIYEHDTDHELCYRLGEKSIELVSINSFLASAFTEAQINEI
jgi:predicted amidophosphoribosyltransferase